MRLPYLKPVMKYDELQDTFLGYNHNIKIMAQEWFDATNISPRAFPVFAPREPRGLVKTLSAPHGMIARDNLVYVDGAALYINHKAVTGLTLGTSNAFLPKQLVSMGAYVLVFPDKVYVNTADQSDYGYIDASYSFTGDVKYTPARVDGTDVSLVGVIIGTEPPLNPANSDYWIDTGNELGDVLRQYSALSDVWTEIPSVYTKIEMADIGDYFKRYDGVEIAGCVFAGTEPNVLKQIAALNGSKIIYAIGDDYIIVTGILSKVHTQEDATVTVKRSMPDMDFIIESENRLWGCKYGIVGDETVNEIYCCVQGDFKNWKRFMGISTDSYAASVGTDGKFTGAITYLGYPTFFKETAMHRVYGSAPSSYRIDTTDCRGVQEGSHKSLAIVNEQLFYKGRTEVLVFDGSLPYGVSDALGGITYREAVAGAYKDRFYISMKDADGWHLFCYDTMKRLWYREDATKVMDFAQVDDELYYIDAITKALMACYGKAGTLEEAIPFMAQTGIIGYAQKDHKYVSRLNIRAKLIPTMRTHLMVSGEVPVTAHLFEAASQEAGALLITAYLESLNEEQAAAAKLSGLYYYDTTAKLIKKRVETDPITFETQHVSVTDTPALAVMLRYDSEGSWINAGSINSTGLVGTTMLPIRPKRCDHFEMKLVGIGDVRIFSIARVLEVGSDGR